MSVSPPRDPLLDDGHEPSIGAFLARQRKLRGITLEELEAATRVPRRSLERLESGAFDAGRDGFARGFVRTVADALGLDPDETLARMLDEPDARARRDPGQLLRAAGLAAAGLLAVVGAAGLVWLVTRAPAAPVEVAPARPARDVVMRRDPVRALAAAHAAQRPALPAGEEAAR